MIVSILLQTLPFYCLGRKIHNASSIILFTFDKKCGECLWWGGCWTSGKMTSSAFSITQGHWTSGRTDPCTERQHLKSMCGTVLWLRIWTPLMEMSINVGKDRFLWITFFFFLFFFPPVKEVAIHLTFCKYIFNNFLHLTKNPEVTKSGCLI